MWLNWLPWQAIVRRAARARGFVDPIALLSHLHRFAQPSEVAAPMELLRAGVVFHARGLMNTGAIQHNLDWIWPYWVERQFDPHDVSFIPRAFSITHVNLTHRNWTAVGLPDCDWLPIVDPRGLLTPYWDSWSLDGWVVADDGRELFPSRLGDISQRLELAGGVSGGVAVVTQSSHDSLSLTQRADLVLDAAGRPICREQFAARVDRGGWLVVALRPCNPEGVRFVHEIALDGDRRHWRVDGRPSVEFNLPVEGHRLSTYRQGDVRMRLLSPGDERSVKCDVGMATAAAMFRLEPDRLREIEVRVPLEADPDCAPSAVRRRAFPTWSQALADHCQLEIPDSRFQFLYDAALSTLVLHSPEDVYPGPYTYKRFWFRDAAFILHAMLCAGLIDRAARAIDRFPQRQTHAGYFRSQEGEWDSNGEALWTMHRFCALTGREPSAAWRQPILKGAQWIIHKRLADDLGVPHAGLLPSGFSAEHLGPNDFYYWDDFWSVAGLRAAATLAESWGDHRPAAAFRAEAQKLLAAVDRSLQATAAARHQPGIPASPYRRMDAGAIGSLAAGYPLQLWAPDDKRLAESVDFLVRECFFQGGFFQDMIHSGINPYLTLHVAQVQLRAGEADFFQRMQAVAQLASPTGQWPEAIHPRTLGGCMGDGQHVWAAAEWVLLVRNCFVREEGDSLVLGSGIPAAWLEGNLALSFGPTLTPYGAVTVRIEPGPKRVSVRCEGVWRASAPRLEVRLPDFEPRTLSAGESHVVLERSKVG